jgi:hypothetical protein
LILAICMDKSKMPSNKRKQPSQTNIVFAVTKRVFYTENDDYESISYNNEWNVETVTMFFSKEAARDWILREGGQLDVDNKDLSPAIYYACDDFVEDSKFQEAFMQTYDTETGTYIADVPLNKCTIYTIISINEGESVFCGREEASFDDMHETVRLRLLIPVNDTLTTKKYKFRLGYEEEDLMYHVKDLTERQLAKWRCPIAKPLNGRTSKNKSATYQEICVFLGINNVSEDEEEAKVIKKAKPIYIEPYLVVFKHENKTEVYTILDAKRLCETNPDYVQTMLSSCKIVVHKDYGESYKDFHGTYVLFHLFEDRCQYFRDTHTWNVIKVTVEDVLQKLNGLIV